MSKSITKKVFLFEELRQRAKEAQTKYTDRCERWIVEQRINAVVKAEAHLSQRTTTRGWWAAIYRDWEGMLHALGADTVDISFNGFGSQGDGASFTCNFSDLETLVKFLAQPPDPLPELYLPGESPHTPAALSQRCLGHLVHRLTDDGRSPIKSDPELRRLKTGRAIPNLTVSIQRDTYGGNYVHERTCHCDVEYYRIEESGWKDQLEPLLKSFSDALEDLRYRISCAIYSDLEDRHDELVSDENLERISRIRGLYFDKDGHYEKT